VKCHYVEFGLFGVTSDFGYVFYNNLDCVLLLFVFIRLDRKYYLYFYLNCWKNCFYKVLICSLPSGDLLLQTECKYTIVQINTQCNVLVNQVFANPVSVFVLLEFRSLDNITVCILILSFCLCYSVRVSVSFKAALWTCFWSLSLFVFQSHKTFHVEEPRRTQQSYTSFKTCSTTEKNTARSAWIVITLWWLKTPATHRKSFIWQNKLTRERSKLFKKHLKTQHTCLSVICCWTSSSTHLTSSVLVQKIFQTRRQWFTYLVESNDVTVGPPRIDAQTSFPGELKDCSKYPSAGDDLIKCICDCTLNVLKGNVRVPPKQKSKLKRHKKALRDLAKKKVSLKRKRQIIQKGGFLAPLLSAVVPAIASLLTGFSRR